MAQAQPVRVPGGGRGRPVPHQRLTRPALAWAAGSAGLLTYNWWVLVPFRPGLMRSPNELPPGGDLPLLG